MLTRRHKDARQKLIDGKVIITQEGDTYLTGNIHNPDDFIYLPIDTSIYENYAIHGIKKAVEILHEEETIIHKKCIVLSNKEHQIVEEEDLTWIEEIQTWAFFRPKSLKSIL